VFSFINGRRTEAYRNGARESHQKLPKSAIEPDVRAAFGHFIAKTCWLEEGREDRTRTKDWDAGRRRPSGKATAKGRTNRGAEGNVN
jgi:hypothetical protein